MLDVLLQQDVGRPEADALRDHDGALRLLAGGDHGPDVAGLDGHRFLRQHVLLGLDRGKEQVLVVAGRHADVDQIDLRILNQLESAVVDCWNDLTST